MAQVWVFKFDDQGLHLPSPSGYGQYQQVPLASGMTMNSGNGALVYTADDVHNQFNGVQSQIIAQDQLIQQLTARITALETKVASLSPHP